MTYDSGHRSSFQYSFSRSNTRFEQCSNTYFRQQWSLVSGHLVSGHLVNHCSGQRTCVRAAVRWGHHSGNAVQRTVVIVCGSEEGARSGGGGGGGGSVGGGSSSGGGSGGGDGGGGGGDGGSGGVPSPIPQGPEATPSQPMS